MSSGVLACPRLQNGIAGDVAVTFALRHSDLDGPAPHIHVSAPYTWNAVSLADSALWSLAGHAVPLQCRTDIGA